MSPSTGSLSLSTSRRRRSKRRSHFGKEGRWSTFPTALKPVESKMLGGPTNMTLELGAILSERVPFPAFTFPAGSGVTTLTGVMGEHLTPIIDVILLRQSVVMGIVHEEKPFGSFPSLSTVESMPATKTRRSAHAATSLAAAKSDVSVLVTLARPGAY